MSNALPEIIAIYRGSNGEATKALYARLDGIPLYGALAVNLFRSQKASERAKVYRGGDSRGRYRTQAYDRKQWAMNNLCTGLEAVAPGAGIRWGWGEDDKQPYHRHVLYIDLPTGQVSFHTAARGSGPDYPGQWDGVPGQSVDRILRWLARLLDDDDCARLKAAAELLGRTVRFAHEPNGPDRRIAGMGSNGMVIVDGLVGEFAPHLFVIAHLEYRYIIAENAREAQNTAEIDWHWQPIRDGAWRDHERRTVRYLSAFGLRGYRGEVYFGHCWFKRRDADEIEQFLSSGLIRRLEGKASRRP